VTSFRTSSIFYSRVSNTQSLPATMSLSLETQSHESASNALIVRSQPFSQNTSRCSQVSTHLKSPCFAIALHSGRFHIFENTHFASCAAMSSTFPMNSHPFPKWAHRIVSCPIFCLRYLLTIGGSMGTWLHTPTALVFGKFAMQPMQKNILQRLHYTGSMNIWEHREQTNSSGILSLRNRFRW